MKTLVLIRHGQSVWNQENRFTGWTDVRLSEKGVQEARSAGKLLKARGYEFDLTYTSVLSRAIQTLHFVLDELDQLYLPVVKDWRLNERHYGSLQGLNKAETAQKYGDEQVHIWRRSYDISPPALEPGDPRLPDLDPRYASLSATQKPATESLKDTIDRVVPYWEDALKAEVLAGKRLLIAAHGNTLRGLIKHFDGLSDQEITKVEVPTGAPLVYQFSDALEVTNKFYLE